MDFFRFVLHLILTWQHSIIKSNFKNPVSIVSTKLQTLLLVRQTNTAVGVALYPHLPRQYTPENKIFFFNLHFWQHRQSILMYKTLHGMTPDYLRSIFVQ